MNTPPWVFFHTFVQIVLNRAECLIYSPLQGENSCRTQSSCIIDIQYHQSSRLSSSKWGLVNRVNRLFCVEGGETESSLISVKNQFPNKTRIHSTTRTSFNFSFLYAAYDAISKHEKGINFKFTVVFSQKICTCSKSTIETLFTLF